jgi:hypothetical protein
MATGTAGLAVGVTASLPGVVRRTVEAAVQAHAATLPSSTAPRPDATATRSGSTSMASGSESVSASPSGSPSRSSAPSGRSAPPATIRRITGTSLLLGGRQVQAADSDSGSGAQEHHGSDGSGDVDGPDRERELERLVRQIERRVLGEIERRGGRLKGWR